MADPRAIPLGWYDGGLTSLRFFMSADPQRHCIPIASCARTGRWDGMPYGGQFNESERKQQFSDAEEMSHPLNMGRDVAAI